MLLAAFSVDDLPPYPVEGEDQPGLQSAETRQVRRQIGHTFDTGRLVMQGSWESETTARRKFTSWVAEYGSMPGARITLTDEQQGSVLTTLPGEG